VTAPQTAPPAAESLAGTFAVQLLSARSEDDAAREWARLSQQHSILLSALAHEIARAEIAGRGTYFRLRVGSFDSASEAGALCTALKSQGQDCLVVKR
jgi:cell division septation protein DedD